MMRTHPRKQWEVERVKRDENFAFTWTGRRPDIPHAGDNNRVTQKTEIQWGVNFSPLWIIFFFEKKDYLSLWKIFFFPKSYKQIGNNIFDKEERKKNQDLKEDWKTISFTICSNISCLNCDLPNKVWGFGERHWIWSLGKHSTAKRVVWGWDLSPYIALPAPSSASILPMTLRPHVFSFKIKLFQLQQLNRKSQKNRHRHVTLERTRVSPFPPPEEKSDHKPQIDLVLKPKGHFTGNKWEH